jgi:hypothetical protein
MAFTFLSYEDPALFAVPFPPPAAARVIKVIESADPADMEKRVQAALDEVVAQNVLIAAAYPGVADVLLSLADCDLAGAGDGHTFVFTMFFVPQVLNNLAGLLSDSPPGTLLPELFRFNFAVAGERDALESQIQDAIARGIGVNENMITIFQFLRGAAKGTRFMFGVGGIPEGGGG